MGESLGLGKKSSGPETDTETRSWFRLPIPKPGFGCTLPLIHTLKRSTGSKIQKLFLVCVFDTMAQNIFPYSANHKQIM